MHRYPVEIGCRARKEEVILLTPVVQTHHFTHSVTHYYWTHTTSVVSQDAEAVFLLLKETISRSNLI